MTVMKTLIKNGILADPAAGINGRKDILISNGKIAEVSEPGKIRETAERVIDAGGLTVSPGFIDIHMHEDPLNAEGKIEPCIFNAMLKMGVTTAVGGNCGSNKADPGDYLDIADRDGAPVNVCLFAGHQFYREKAGARDKYKKITEEQLSLLMQGLSRALSRGCIGISYGLRYVPGTDREEFLKTAALCAPEKRLISAHVRDDAAGIFKSVDEVAEAGKLLNIPLEISHMGSMGGFGQMKELIRRMEQYRAEGLDMTADCYPYDAFSTDIGETTYDDGWMERYHCGYDVIELCEEPYKGQRCTEELFRKLRKERPDMITVCHVMKPEDVRLAMEIPWCMIGSDGYVDNGFGHPRAAGTFPHFFDAYVRNGNISLMDGIAKMSTLAAGRLGLKNKGCLTPGADADLVIFNPDVLAARSTYDQPMLSPVGIRFVLIAGEIAVQDNEIKNGHLGRSVRFESVF